MSNERPNVVQEQELTAEQREVLEKYDSESRYRVFANRGVALLVTLIAVGLSLYHLYTAYAGPLVTLKHRSLHVAVVLALIFLLYPVYKSQSKRHLPWYDVILALLAVSTTVYVFIEYLGIVNRGGLPNTLDLVFGAILVLLVLEAARRVTGWALPLLALLFLVYGLVGRQLSGIFMHRGYSWEQIVNFMYTTTEGIYGTAIGVSASYIFLFILFGSFLAKSGMGQFFNDMALAIAGHTKGGPAKVSVIASGFLAASTERRWQTS